ncbi:MAG: dihydroorotate dehydrogenase [PVC group bacterium]|nr:dihydroorotate dehydrogenase [PVC group bacterium]
MNLHVKLGKLKLKNPVTVASGTFGYAKEFEDLVSVKSLGAIITKTITVNPRLGNPPPRLAETASGMLNAIGLQNEGLDNFLKFKYPALKKIGTEVIVSISAQTKKDFIFLAQNLESAGVKAVEVNLSCPNISYAANNSKKNQQISRAKSFAQDAKATYDVVSALRKKTKLTLIVKLTPNVTDITEIALAAERAGADVLSLVNTFLGMAIDVETRLPKIANITGGLSGPAIKPLAVRMVYDVARAVKIPVIGVGGIMSAEDALEFMIAGARAISVGTASFVNPKAAIEIIEGLKLYCKENKIKDINKLVGKISL